MLLGLSEPELEMGLGSHPSDLSDNESSLSKLNLQDSHSPPPPLCLNHEVLISQLDAPLASTLDPELPHHKLVMDHNNDCHIPTPLTPTPIQHCHCRFNFS